MRWSVLMMAAIVASGVGTTTQGQESNRGETLRAYIGTYTRGSDSQGIYFADLNVETGALSVPRLAAEVTNPSFLAIHPNGKWLYAVSEVEAFRESKGGAVVAFDINADGTLTQKNAQPSGGGSPCHLIVDRAGKNVLVANYSGGNVAVLPLEADGRLKAASQVVQHEGKGIDPRRQEGPHAHSINLDPAGRFALVADLGLDRVFVYQFDADAGRLTPASQPFAEVQPGAGPRHLAFHPSGRLVFVINEMGSTINTFAYDPETGALTPGAAEAVSTLPAVNAADNTTAEIRVHPSGRFVYGSNRGHDTLAQFAVDSEKNTLSPLGHTAIRGRTPRNFEIEPSGRLLIIANQGTDRVIPFRIAPETGMLTPVGNGIPVPAPVCIRFLVSELK
jgi:6-phosphogluconolactonase